MNTPLRRVGLAMLAMIVLLLANATYVQVVKADDYRNDPRNRRVLLDEYARKRGRIIAADGGDPRATSRPTNDRLRFLRTYAERPGVRAGHRLLLGHATARPAWSAPRTTCSTAPTTGCSCAGCPT